MQQCRNRQPSSGSYRLSAWERLDGQHPFGNPATTSALWRDRGPRLCAPAFRPVSPFEDEEAQQAYLLADPVTRRRSCLEKRRRGRNRFTTARRPCSPATWPKPHCLCIGNLVRFPGLSNRVGNKIFRKFGKIIERFSKCRIVKEIGRFSATW